MSEVRRLRAQARQVQRRTGAKISRLESKGIHVRGSEFDPRQDIRRADKMNSRQLRSYIKRLNAFNSRDNQFLASAEGNPIPQRMWEDYKNAEAKYNRVARRNYNRYKNTFIPESGMTVDERQNTIVNNSITAQKGAASRGYMEINRKSPRNINGASALQQLTQNLRTRASGKGQRMEMVASKLQASEMLDRIGAPHLKDNIANMSDKQFDLLWNFTSFATDLSDWYESMKDASKSNSNYDPNQSETESAIESRLKWAASQ